MLISKASVTVFYSILQFGDEDVTVIRTSLTGLFNKCLPERIVQMLCQSSTKTAPGKQSQEDVEQLMLFPRLRRLKSWSRLQAEGPELQVIRKCLIERKWDPAPKQYLYVSNEN